MGELEPEDVAGIRNLIRMDPAHFFELLHRIGDRITKQNTWYRQALEPGLKLSIALRYYAAGDRYQSLMYSFRVAHNAILKIVFEVSNAIVAGFAMEVQPHLRSGERFQMCLQRDGSSSMSWAPLIANTCRSGVRQREDPCTTIIKVFTLSF